MKKRYFIFLLLVVFVWAGVFSFTPAQAAPKLAGKTVKIGGLFGVSGVCAEWGMNGKVGAEIAAEEINAAGGIGGLFWKSWPNKTKCSWSTAPARARRWK
jgi:ABC-type branched-subunit amino acid transport system substrate-binding protein